MQWLWIIPAAPLLGACVQALLILTKKSSPRIASVLGIVFPALSLSVTLATLWQYLSIQHPDSFEQALFTWLDSDLRVEVALYLDPISAVMLSVLALAGFLVAVSSAGPQKADPDRERLLAGLGFLQGSLLLLVLARDMVVLLVAWQAIALTSTSIMALCTTGNARPRWLRKLFLLHRIGDLGLLAALGICITRFGTSTLHEIGEAASNSPVPSDLLDSGSIGAALLALFLLIAAGSRGFALPFVGWLGDHRGAPPGAAAYFLGLVPISGIYLLIRLSGAFESAPRIAGLLATLGLTLALLAGTSAIAQTHVTRALALVGISHIGLIFVAVGIGAVSESVFHLVTLTCSMPLLLLASGAISRILDGQTDLRLMGGMRSLTPLISKTSLLATLAISGLPGLSGFFSEGQIIMAIWQSHRLLALLAAVAILASAFAVWRVYWLMFWGEHRGEGTRVDELDKASTAEASGLLALGLGCILVGWLGRVPFTDSDLLGSFLGVTNASTSVMGPSGSTQFVEALVLLVLSVVFAVSLVLSWRVYGADFGIGVSELWAKRYPAAHRALKTGYGFDRVIEGSPKKRLRAFAMWQTDAIDGKLLPLVPAAAMTLPRVLGEILRHSTSGNVRHYKLYFLAGCVLLFFWISL